MKLERPDHRSGRSRVSRLKSGQAKSLSRYLKIKHLQKIKCKCFFIEYTNEYNQPYFSNKILLLTKQDEILLKVYLNFLEWPSYID